jgi:hypothetical protein
MFGYRPVEMIGGGQAGLLQMVIGSSGIDLIGF